MKRNYWVYILASGRNGTLYTGVTNDLLRRIIEHKKKQNTGFTKKYNVDILVWYANGDSIESAIVLEKKIKNRGRQWKIDLIEKSNPKWEDLSKDFLNIDNL